MAELRSSLEQMLDGQADKIGSRIGADPDQTKTAIHAAVPALLAALGQNAEQGSGVKQAIERDHDGSIIDQLSEYLGGTAQLSPRTTNGAGILEHTLGDRQGEMAQALSAKSGLDLGSIAKLLPLLAPIVMGMLGKKGRSGDGSSGGFSLDNIGDLLNREKADARSTNPEIGDILDRFGQKDRPGSSTARKEEGGGIMDTLDDMFGKKGS
jgi:hypothetical protein